ncbi:hypothetical protein SpiGrapes_0368 [Sphaerochaeta pleomorpha str. Grapes]|uniref:Lipoprotein n=1 Tax=Sphaerochaeta pleomorpha (strain ATCC BAA-1885 / DSM 22778 / Grapes) TaxID=158190 RepID=G8QVJ3_SPHPG|nr:hypothetical protein [Sphaerochaeta pleomorpha]AEV28226.1 hypothetical protein SpiGrapes_0368 [Sphaerochaeta pleomorpha str. Grapes]
MKKLTPIFGFLVFLALLVSCNSDASEGIFRQISQTTTPSGIVYTRLLGIDSPYLYFQTNEGVYRIASSSTNASTQLVASEKYDPLEEGSGLIKGVAYAASNDKLYVLKNFTDSFYRYDSDGTNRAKIIVSDTYTSTNLSTYTINNLYSNSMLVLEGQDGSSNAGYDIAAYDGATVTEIVGFSSIDISGYGLDNFLMQTTRQDDATAPIIISFADSSDSDTPAYLHYLVDPSGKKNLISDINDVRLANFYYDGSNLYILTYEGKLYFYNTVDSTSETDITGKILLKDSSQDYNANAFFYPVPNTAGTALNLVSKYSTKASSLYVFSVDTGTNTLSGTASISKGYAEYLDASNIVSALETTTSTTSVPNLIVATRKNGMFEITIDIDSANLNTSLNGTSSVSEDYTF